MDSLYILCIYVTKYTNFGTELYSVAVRYANVGGAGTSTLDFLLPAGGFVDLTDFFVLEGFSA